MRERCRLVSRVWRGVSAALPLEPALYEKYGSESLSVFTHFRPTARRRRPTHRPSHRDRSIKLQGHSHSAVRTPLRMPHACAQRSGSVPGRECHGQSAPSYELRPLRTLGSALVPAPSPQLLRGRDGGPLMRRLRARRGGAAGRGRGRLAARLAARLVRVRPRCRARDGSRAAGLGLAQAYG